MKIEVRKLIASEKYTGSFDYDYTPPEDICLVPLCKIAGDVKVTGEFEIYDDDSVGVFFTVRYKITGQCSYCLESAEKEISFKSEVLFVPQKDDENYFYDGIKFDLKPAVDDAILISQPHLLLCNEDCKGIDIT